MQRSDNIESIDAGRDTGRPVELTMLQRRLLDEFQRDFPLVSDPFAEIAARVGCDADTVIATLHDLKARGFISRIGPVIRPHTVGTSTLCAMAVRDSEIEQIARCISAYREVNHNYLREHAYNLWFVVTATDDDSLASVLADIENHCGYPVMSLPMLEDYFIDLGFALDWRNS